MRQLLRLGLGILVLMYLSELGVEYPVAGFVVAAVVAYAL